MNGNILSLQLALFFNDLEPRPDKLVKKLEVALEDMFDQMPTILPIPNEAPPEIPTVILKNSDGSYICQIARSRIDLIYNTNQPNVAATVFLNNFLKVIQVYGAVIFGSKDISRFGFVGRYFFEDKSPFDRIKSKYLKNDLGELTELNIRYNKRFNYNGITLNDVVEIGKGEVMDKENENPSGIVIQRDMNNIPIEDELLTLDNVVSIIKSRNVEFDAPGISGLIV